MIDVNKKCHYRNTTKNYIVNSGILPECSMFKKTFLNAIYSLFILKHRKSLKAQSFFYACTTLEYQVYA